MIQKHLRTAVGYLLKGLIGLMLAVIVTGGVLFLRIRYGGPLDLAFLHPFLSGVTGRDVTWEKMHIAWSPKEGVFLNVGNLHHPSLQAENLRITSQGLFHGKRRGPRYHIQASKIRVSRGTPSSSHKEDTLSQMRSFFKRHRLACEEMTFVTPKGHILGQISVSWDGVMGTLSQNNEKIGTVTLDPDGGLSLDFHHLALAPFAQHGEVKGPVMIKGRISLPSSKNAVIFRLYQLKGNSCVLGKKNQTVGLKEGWVEGEWTTEKISAQGGLTVGEARLCFHGHDTDAQGCAPGEREMVVDISQKAGALNIKDLHVLWPESVGTSAREWILANFRGGAIPLLKGQIALCVPVQGDITVQDLKGKLGIRSVTLSFMEGMPVIQDLEAVSDVCLKGFDIRILKGTFHKQNLTGGTLHIGPLVGLPKLSLALCLSGPFHSLVHIMSRFSSLKDIPLKDLQGQSVTKVTSGFPLLADLKKDQISIAIDSRVKGASFTMEVAGRNISVNKGTLDIKGSEEKLTVKGNSEIEGIPTQWSWSDKGYLAFKSHLSPHHIKSLFQVNIDPYVRSSFDVIGQYEAKKTRVRVDLGQTVCALPWIFWEKPAGEPMSIYLDLSGAGKDKTYHIDVVGALKGKALIRLKGQDPFVMAEVKTAHDWCKYKYHNHEHRLFFRGQRVCVQETPPLKESHTEQGSPAKGNTSPAKTLAQRIQNQNQFYLKKTHKGESLTNGGKIEEQKEKRLPLFTTSGSGSLVRGDLVKKSSGGSSVQGGLPSAKDMKRLSQNTPPCPLWRAELEKQNYFYKNRDTYLEKRNLGKSSPPHKAALPSELSKRGQGTVLVKGENSLVVHLPKVQFPHQNASQSHESQSATPLDKFYVDIECGELLAGEVRLLRCYARAQGRLINSEESLFKFSNIRWDQASAFATVIKKKNASKKNPKKGHFVISVQPKPQGNVIIQLDSTDLGALLGGFGITDKVKAGRIHLIAQQDAQGVYTGFVKARDFKTKAPFLGKLIAMISPMMVTELFSSGLFFHEVSGHFHYHDGQLTVDQGVGKGVNLGLSLRGQINCEQSTANLSGAIVPGYLLNTFFRYVPILGWLFGGDQGIVSTEFKLTGALSNPKIRIEPLSIFKFGFMKDLFRDPSDQLTWEKDFLKEHKIP